MPVVTLSPQYRLEKENILTYSVFIKTQGIWTLFTSEVLRDISSKNYKPVTIYLNLFDILRKTKDIYIYITEDILKNVRNQAILVTSTKKTETASQLIQYTLCTMYSTM